ncbi:MAG: OmpH family outer membrane protein [Chitinophagaceae bacterium]
MKKFNLIITFTLLIGMSTFAQQKFGYTNVDQIVMFLPEVKNIETQLQEFKKDSLDALLPYLISEYTKKDSLMKIEKNDVVKQRIAKELDDLQQQLQNWQSYAQSRMQSKQEELLKPLYQKVGEALKQVVDKNKYTYIFSYNALLYAPPAEDISLLLLKELGIDTAELEKQAAAAAAGQMKTPPPTNPKTTKKNN